MPTEYRCIDCGVEVVDVGRDAPPEPAFCASCAFLAEIADPEEREQVRRLLAPFSERE